MPTVNAVLPSTKVPTLGANGVAIGSRQKSPRTGITADDRCDAVQRSTFFHFDSTLSRARNEVGFRLP